MSHRRLPVLAAALAALAAPGLHAQKTQVWSEPTRTEQVDPRRMERAEPVRNPGPFDGRLSGTWDLWVPGGVWYSSNGQTTYRRYTAGAPMNRLQIAGDGTFAWAGRQGRLVEVRPWHAQAGVRYYQIPHPGGGTYDLYLCTPEAARTLCGASEGKLILLFGGVGGHAATGTRQGGRAAPAARPPAAGYRAGDRVSVEWRGSWYDATILQVEPGRYRVHYDGWASNWDEWVVPGRVRRRQ